MSNKQQTITTVDGIESFVGASGRGCSNARFSYQRMDGGSYEVLMLHNGARRFATCTHENDAEHIVACLNDNKHIPALVVALRHYADIDALAMQMLNGFKATKTMRDSNSIAEKALAALPPELRDL